MLPLLLAQLCVASPPLVLAVGVNRPAARNLPPLKHADDDAAAAAELFLGGNGSAWLLTDMDTDTQERFPQAVAAARRPSLRELDRAVAEMGVEIQRRIGAGEQPVVLVWLVGHGDFDSGGQPFFAMEDGPLLRTDLDTRVIAPLAAAHRLHVLVDACHSEALVKWRARAEAADARAVDLQWNQGALPANTGVVVAARATQRTFEWTEMRSGIFSALVRSALRGAANADGDTAVGYQELAAYVQSALQGIPLPDARPTLRAQPPRMDAQAPLSTRAWFPNARTWASEAGALGAFQVETLRGNWMAGGHFEPRTSVELWLPGDGELVVSSREARWHLQPEGDQHLVMQPDGAPSTVARGVLEDAVKKGLFSSPYGPAFFRGYSAAHQTFEPPEPEQPRGSPRPLPVRWHLAAWLAAGPLVLGAPAAVASLVGLAALSGFALQNALAVTEKTAFDSRQRALITAALLPVPVAVTGLALLLAGGLLALDLLLQIL